MPQSPLVSILINNRNYARFLDSCVRSALDQTYTPLEVIVYDDGSTDASLSVLRAYSDRIRVIEGLHQDLPGAFNQAKAIAGAFASSSGALVCLLDSDDTFLPSKVRCVVEAFACAPSAVLVQHPFLEIDESGRRTGIRKPPLSSRQPRELIYRTHSLSDVFAQTSALSFRREYLEQVLPIVPDRYDKLWADVRLSRLSVFYGDTVTLKEPLGEHRVHSANDSAKLMDARFLGDLVEQLYAFFNEHGRLKGYPEVRLDDSPTRPGLQGWRRLSAQWHASVGLTEKMELVRRWAYRMRQRRRARPEAAERHGVVAEGNAGPTPSRDLR